MAFRKGNNGIDEFNTLKKDFPKSDIHYLLVDITNPEGTTPYYSERSQLAMSIKDQFKSIDVLVNNAALGYDEPFEVPARALAEGFLNCNFNSTVILTELLLPLLAQDGKVINVSSRVGALENHSEVPIKFRI